MTEAKSYEIKVRADGVLAIQINVNWSGQVVIKSNSQEQSELGPSQQTPHIHKK